MRINDELRQAAVNMRRRAQLARPYGVLPGQSVSPAQWADEVDTFLGGTLGQHCGSWTPAVANAVADLLDLAADDADADLSQSALAIARTYLGDPRTVVRHGVVYRQELDTRVHPNLGL